MGRSLECEGDWVTEALAATAWGRVGTEPGRLAGGRCLQKGPEDKTRF